MLRDADDTTLNELRDFANPAASLGVDSDVGPWLPGRVRLFLTHLAREKVFVRNVKRLLRPYGIDGFVAHMDIHPSSEWIATIETALRTCDALCAFMHEGFRRSAWCDQEVGAAFGLQALLIPVMFNDSPYGFLGKYQAIRAQHLDEGSLASSIADTLLQSSRTRERAIDGQIGSLVDAANFYAANSAAERLEAADVKWTTRRLDRLEASLNNAQVSGAYDAAPFIERVLEEQRPPPPPPPGDDEVPF